MKGGGEVDEPRQLNGAVGGPATTVEMRVAANDGDWPAVEPRESGNNRAAVLARNFKERIVIEHRIQMRRMS